MSVAIVLCTRCGHDVSFHGRRGHGRCRSGHVDRLALAVAVVRVGVAQGFSQEDIASGIDAALSKKSSPCDCPRMTHGRRTAKATTGGSP